MKIEQVVELLQKIGVEISVSKKLDTLEKTRNIDENYYKLVKKNNQWAYVFVESEKTTNTLETIERKFNNENEALTFFYLLELSVFFKNKYIYPFESKHENIFEDIYKLDDIKIENMFQKINIPKEFYDFKNVKSGRRIAFNTIQSDASQIIFFSKEGKILFQSIEMENWESYWLMFRSVYLLYLVESYANSLLEMKLIDRLFTDEEYSLIL